MDPEENIHYGKRGLNLDFMYNYEMFDAEEYGNESIKKFSKIISEKIFIWSDSANKFTFELSTN